MKKYIIALLTTVLLTTTANAGMWKNLYPTWTDSLVPGLAARSGPTAPTFDVFRGGIFQSYFQGVIAGQNDEVHFTIQFPHSYKEQSTIDFHVHTACSATGVGGNNTIDLCVEYQWQPIGGTFSTLTTTACRTFLVGNWYVHELWEITDINGIGFGTGVSSIFLGRVWRNKTGGRDNYTGNMFLLSIDLHFLQDTSGSWLEYSK